MGLERLPGFEVEGVGLGEIHVLVRDGECARLVDDEGVYLAEVLQCRGIFDQYLLLCRLAYAHHEGGRGGESHGARTGDDQYRDGREDGLWQGSIAACNPPGEEGDEREEGDHGHEDQCRLIDDALYGSLRTLCLLHHLDDLCEGGVLAYLLGTHPQFALARDGASQYLVAHFLLGRCRFASDHCLVHVGGIGGHEALGFGHHAIHRNLLAGTYLDDVATLDGGDRHFLQVSLTEESGGLRLQSHQLSDAARRTILSLLFQASARQDEGDDHHGGIEVGVPLDATRRPYTVAEEGVEDAEEEGDEGAQCHERIHVGSGVLQLLPCRYVKHSAAVPHVEEGEEETDLVVTPPHGKRHDEDGEEPGEEGLALEQGIFTAGDFLRTTVFLDDEVVAGIAHLTLHVFERNLVGIVIHEGSATCQGDGGRVDAFERIELLFYVGRAYRACHAYYWYCFLHLLSI